MLEVSSNVDQLGDVFRDIEGMEKKLHKSREVRVGFFQDARYSEGSRPYVASVAMWQEFESVARNAEGGARKPARPFMREAINNPQTQRNVIKLFRGYPDNPDRSLSLIGESVKAAIQNSITTGPWRDLAKSTVARRRRGSDKPLLDTGYLRSSVTYQKD